MAAQEYIIWITIVYFALPLDGSRGALTDALPVSGENVPKKEELNPRQETFFYFFLIFFFLKKKNKKKNS